MGITIVAIPEQDDPVWKVSSEKIPHLTLLYMEGPLRNEEQTLQFVQHVAVTSFRKFGLSVDRRDTLGPEDADVLFFENYFTKDLISARSHLLTNTSIAEAYRRAEQYPKWTPHLTLGYPATPAKPNPNDYGIHWVNFDRIAVWFGDYEGPEFRLKSEENMALDTYHADLDNLSDDFLAHFGVRGMKWGVRKDEKPLGRHDVALNIAQRQQVKIANTISTLASVGLATNAAAAGFQLQSRWEHLQVVRTLIEQAENNPLLSDAAREGLRVTKDKVVRGLVASAAATTAVTFAIGALATRSSKAYFAPLHKAYGDVKPKVNADLRKLSKEIKKGERPSMTVKQYNEEVSKIVSKHLTADRSNILSPFHELARSQLGTEYNTKSLNIKFEKLPNTDLYDKMTVVTPNGLKLVKAIKKVEHADDDPEVGDVDFFFDYKFDSEGFVEDWSCPTIEIANLMFEEKFDLDDISKRYGSSEATVEQNALTELEDVLAHFGVPGMKWGVRRRTDSNGLVTGTVDQAIKEGQTPKAGSGKSEPVTKGKKSTDQAKMEENITKKLEELSTADIREITNRIKAVNDYKATTAAEAAKKASLRKKLVDFALGSIQAGAKKAADEYIQELTGETLKGLLPKTKTQQAKDKKQREADEDRAAKKQKEADKAAREQSDKAKPAKSREDAVGDLVYVITNMKDKEE